MYIHVHDMCTHDMCFIKKKNWCGFTLVVTLVWNFGGETVYTWMIFFYVHALCRWFGVNHSADGCVHALGCGE